MQAINTGHYQPAALPRPPMGSLPSLNPLAALPPLGPERDTGETERGRSPPALTQSVIGGLRGLEPAVLPLGGIKETSTELAVGASLVTSLTAQLRSTRAELVSVRTDLDRKDAQLKEQVPPNLVSKAK